MTDSSNAASLQRLEQQVASVAQSVQSLATGQVQLQQQMEWLMKASSGGGPNGAGGAGSFRSAGAGASDAAAPGVSEGALVLAAAPAALATDASAPAPAPNPGGPAPRGAPSRISFDLTGQIKKLHAQNDMLRRQVRGSPRPHALGPHPSSRDFTRARAPRPWHHLRSRSPWPLHGRLSTTLHARASARRAP